MVNSRTMANSKSAKARVITNLRDEAKNKAVKSELKSLVSKLQASIAAKDAGLNDLVKQTISRFDSAVSKGVLKKQTAARKKSRIMALVNKAAKAK